VTLNQIPEVFHSVLFAGVPFGRGVAFLRDMHCGSVVGTSKKILSTKVLFSHASQFVFFPEKDAKMVDKDHKPIPIDLFSVDDWIKYKLAIFAEVTPTDEQKEHLKKCLETAKIFRQEVVFKPNVKYPPIAVLNSKSKNTFITMMQDGPKSVNGWDFDTMPQKPGDGRMKRCDTRPPKGVPFKEYTCEQGHAELLNDTIVLQILQDLLLPPKETESCANTTTEKEIIDKESTSNIGQSVQIEQPSTPKPPQQAKKKSEECFCADG